MDQSPVTLEQLARLIVRELHKTDPNIVVEPLQPPFANITAHGIELDIRNLHRRVSLDPENLSEHIRESAQQLFYSIYANLPNLSYDAASQLIMPRIKPKGFLNDLTRTHIAHIPYINGTDIVFTIDLPNTFPTIPTYHMVRWGKTIEDLETQALVNLNGRAENLELDCAVSPEGNMHGLSIDQKTAPAISSYLLSPRLRGSIRSAFKDRDYVVAIPTQNHFLAFIPEPETFMARVTESLAVDFQNNPFPITPDLFHVSRDGVAAYSPAQNKSIPSQPPASIIRAPQELIDEQLRIIKTANEKKPPDTEAIAAARIRIDSIRGCR